MDGTDTTEDRIPINWLRQYESTEIEMSDISLVKEGTLYRKHMQFAAFGNKYNLILKIHAEKLSHNFSIFVEERKLSKTETSKVLKSTGIYDGECTYRDGCHVYGKIDSRWNIFEGEIEMSNDVTYIEKFSKYFNKRRPSGRRQSRLSIIYRRSDIIMEEYQKEFLGTNVDGSTYNYRNDAHPRYTNWTRPAYPHALHKNTTRFRRSGKSKQTCHMYLVADHLFFNVVCRGSVEAAVAEMRYHISIADNTFRSTDFNGDGAGDNVGLALANIKIFRGESDPNNKLVNPPDAQYFLERFAEYDWSEYCLSFVFTANDFGTTLGLAYIGSSNVLILSGGICERRVQFWSDIRNELVESSYNVGMITFRNGLPRLQSSLTFTHEVGHAFGSSHDEETCAPGGEIGNFLMYPYVTSGNLPNNRVFSPCSKDKINPVISNRGAKCFKFSIGSVCGNSIVEDGEECDCGNSETCDSIDPCCSPSDVGDDAKDRACTLRRSEDKLCSPRQSPCCTDVCKYVEASKKKMCSLKSQCRGEAICGGNSADCGAGEQARNGTLCDGGKFVCLDGVCSVSVCVYNGLVDCQCGDDPAHYCSLCCISKNGNCRPAASLGIVKRPDVKKSVGDPCLDNTGVCDPYGTCIEFNPDSALEKLRHIFSRDTMKFARDWFQEYWYFILIAFVAFSLSSALLLPKCRRKSTDAHTQAYKAGKLAKMTCEADILRTADIANIVRVESMIEKRIHLIRHGRAKVEKDLPHAIARLGALFPTAPLDKINDILRGCSSEDVAVRLLIIRGYPMQSVFAKCYKK